VGNVVLSVILCSAIALNVVATVIATRSDFGTPFQKALQVVFVWLVPLVGPMVVVWVVASMRPDRKHRPLVGTSEGIWHPGIGPDSKGGHHDAHGDVSSDGGPGGH
jgi:hypothetical protein